MAVPSRPLNSKPKSKSQTQTLASQPPVKRSATKPAQAKSKSAKSAAKKPTHLSEEIVVDSDDEDAPVEERRVKKVAALVPDVESRTAGKVKGAREEGDEEEEDDEDEDEEDEEEEKRDEKSEVVKTVPPKINGVKRSAAEALEEESEEDEEESEDEDEEPAAKRLKGEDAVAQTADATMDDAKVEKDGEESDEEEDEEEDDEEDDEDDDEEDGDEQTAALQTKADPAPKFNGNAVTPRHDDDDEESEDEDNEEEEEEEDEEDEGMEDGPAEGGTDGAGVAKADVEADAEGTESESEEEDEFSEDATLSAKKPASAQPSVLQSTGSPEVVPAKEFRPPAGYAKVTMPRQSPQHALSKQALSGKQIWHITAPSDVPLSSITEVAADAIASAKPVLSYNGIDYVLNETAELNSALSVFVPDSEGFRALNIPIQKTLAIQQKVTLPNLSRRQASQLTGSAAAGNIAQAPVSSIRPQPKGLRMRYRPYGYGSGDPGKVGSDSEGSDEGNDAPSPSTKAFQFPKTLGGISESQTTAGAQAKETTVPTKSPKKKRKDNPKDPISKTAGTNGGTPQKNPAAEKSHFAGTSAKVAGTPAQQVDASGSVGVVNGLSNVETPVKLSKEEKARLKEEKRLNKEKKMKNKTA